MNIVRAVAQMRALHKCSHEFDFVHRKPDRKGVVGYCPKCRGKFHAGPGTIYYEQIVAGERKGRER